ncbi:hypothetical protein JST97_30730 [bacterium]|nr:hypothetical protein [bacterium]
MIFVPFLFLFSGAAGLTFELIWTRQLGLVLGCTVTSVALVSGFFLLGLGLGARLGEFLSRARNLLGVFAALELGVAVTGLAVAATLPKSAQIVAVLWSAMGGGPLALTMARVLLCGMALLLPCLCMGASLPVLCAYLNERMGARFLGSLSWLYAINTVGAVAGLMVCDNLLIPQFGLWKAAQVAAALDVGVALAAAFLGSAPAPVDPPRAQEESPSAFSLSSLYFACWGLGVAGCWLQVVWTRVLIVFQGNDQHAFSGCLASYLACLAAGAMLAPRLARPGRGLAWVVALASLTSLLSLACLPGARSIGLEHPWLANFLVIAPTGLCLGLSFPWLNQETKKFKGAAAQVVARALLLNTLGSLVGALATALWLIPEFGLQWTYGLAAVWLGLLSLALWVRCWPIPLLAAIVLSWLPATYFRGLFFPEPGQQFLFTGDDSYGSVALISEPDNLGKPVMQLLVDGFNMMSNNLPTQRYATALAAMPCLWHPQPKRVLVICMGLCHSLNTALRDPRTEEVHCVELSPTVIRALSLIPQGRAALSNPKLKLFVGDGRQHLVSTQYRYQVITAEPPPPRRMGAVNLYTRDFYRLCQARLEPGGMMVQWMPIFQMSKRQTRVILRAFLDVFPNAYLLEGCGAQLCLVGCDRPIQIDYSSLRQRVAAHPGLAATGWDRPEFFLGSQLMGPTALATYVEDSPALTDDWPVLQYARDPNDSDIAGLLFGDHPPELEVHYQNGQDELEARQGLTVMRALRRYLCQEWVPASELAAIHAWGEVERAVGARLALRLYPNNIYFLDATLSSDDYLAAFKQSLETHPQDQNLIWTLAQLFYRRGRSLESLEYLHKLGPQAPPAALALEILILLELGRLPEAAQKVSAAGDRLNQLDVRFLKRVGPK